MDAPKSAQPLEGHAAAIRFQAEEHPLIEDVPPATAEEQCLMLIHLRAYDEAVGHAAGRDVLDVGCNTGYGTVRFTSVAKRVVGVDVSPRAIEAARRRAPDGHPEFLVTSGFELPFPDDSFDLVTTFQVLEHVPDPTAFLQEIKRVARPGGTVILATPNAAIRLYPGMTPWNPFHVHEYLAAELRDLLAGVFTQVQLLGMFGVPALYETEIRRVDAARRSVGRRWPIRVARAVLPAFARKWLRAMVSPSKDLKTILQFSVADLFYTNTDLDRAMDLLAVCQLGPPATAD